MRFLLAAVAALTITTPAVASAHRCGHVCHHKLRVIRPYRAWLGSTGACESGTDRNLHHGLHAIGGGGAYRGRYQFSWDTWRRAGGHGDPASASWLEQAYRAVRWRQRIGNPHTTAGWPVCG